MCQKISDDYTIHLSKGFLMVSDYTLHPKILKFSVSTHFEHKEDHTLQFQCAEHINTPFYCERLTQSIQTQVATSNTLLFTKFQFNLHIMHTNILFNPLQEAQKQHPNTIYTKILIKFEFKFTLQPYNTLITKVLCTLTISLSQSATQ